MKIVVYKIIFIVIINFLASEINFSYAKVHEQVSSETFSFLGVGEEDSIKTAINKNKDKGCNCITGKSSSIELNLLSIKNHELLQEIEEILNIDNKLQKWGAAIEIQKFPIDVLHCVPKSDSIFNYWDYFFSNKTNELLSILIHTKDRNSVYEQLNSKHGKCTKKNYCVNQNNYLILKKHKEEQLFIVILFTKNIKSHYDILKIEQIKKKKIEKEHLKNAF